MRPTHSSRRVNPALRPAGVLAFTSRHARLAGLLTLVMVAPIAAVARASSPAAVGPAATSRPASTLQDGSALPLTAQAAVSRAPAADHHRPFRIHRTASGAIIVSGPTRGLQASLIAGRITVQDARGLRVSLSGPAIGRGATLTPVRGFAAPALSKNRVTFASPSTDEWYARSRTGIEQGLAISHRPAARGPLEISQTLSSNAQAHLQAGGQDVRFGSTTTGLRYGQMVVSDAAGTRMRASMSISGHHLTITINDAQAVYPLHVDPTYTLVLNGVTTSSSVRSLGFAGPTVASSVT